MSSFVAASLWVCLHLFLSVRAAGRAAVDRVFRALGLAFLEPRRGLAFCVRTLRRTLEVGKVTSLWSDEGERPPPPRTFAVVVNDPEDASRCLAHLARVLVWAADFGIRHVSLYDQDGFIRESASKLAELVVKATVQADDAANDDAFVPPPSAYAFRVVNPDGTTRVVERFHCGGKATGAPVGRRGGSAFGANRAATIARTAGFLEREFPKRGFQERAPEVEAKEKQPTRFLTVVDLLGARDGTAALLDVAARWGERVPIPAVPAAAGGEVTNAEDVRVVSETNASHVVAGDPETGRTSPEELERWMLANGSLLPSTEVTVAFGKDFHLAGYPPWQLHETELYHRRSLRAFTRRDFLALLSAYAGVRKRNGK